MAVRNFDRKFGAEFLESLPGSPGVYLVYDEHDRLIYVGKAKNLKRRLWQYRNTLRRKKHRRMRGIVKEAARIEIQPAESDFDACFAEMTLIQKHRPRWNIVGAYSFLYPMIGIRSANGDIEFCMTTTPEAVLKECPGFEFHGAFRSRRITGDAFFAQIAEDTLQYVRRDMTDERGGFYSAEDADSLPPEHHADSSTHKMEGAFYVWTADEIRTQLGADAEVFEQRVYVGRATCSCSHGCEPLGPPVRVQQASDLSTKLYRGLTLHRRPDLCLSLPASRSGSATPTACRSSPPTGAAP